LWEHPTAAAVSHRIAEMLGGTTVSAPHAEAS